MPITLTDEQLNQLLARFDHWSGEICSYLNAANKTLDEIRAILLEQEQPTVTIDPPIAQIKRPSTSSEPWTVCTCGNTVDAMRYECPVHGFPRIV